ncbi:aspartyl-phosphate phosphatase Spo0E family protein [Alkaliphilus crotonatoxidans]
MENVNDEIKMLKIKIEEVRAELNQMIRGNDKHAFNEEIIKLSQTLDDLLMEYIKKSAKK